MYQMDFREVEFAGTRKVSDEDDSSREPSPSHTPAELRKISTESLGLPHFERRPLSDTPVQSTWTSPRVSVESTPVASRENSSNNLARFLSATSFTSVEESIKTPKFSHPKKRPATLDVPGLTKSKASPDGTISAQNPSSKLVIVMTGLPATGKSFITNKLSRYLNYSMYYCKAFNVGNTRRQFAKEHKLNDQDSNFFDPNNSDFKKLREKWAMDTLDQLLDYLLLGPGSVGIFDATNTTSARRKAVIQRIASRNPYLEVLFLETVCSDKHVVEENIKLKLRGPDYKGKDPEASLKDFKERLENYRKAYEPIQDEENVQYVKMIDIGKKVIAYNIQGFLASQTVYYLLNFNLAERQIWITRNGESEYNVKGRIGGDSNLTSRGEKYAKALAKLIGQQRTLFRQNQLAKWVEFVKENPSENKDNLNASEPKEFFVWTSTRKRCVETAKYFDEVEFPTKQMKMLEELNAGDCEGMTYAEIQKKYPEGYAERQRGKLRYRYPGIGGESYMDVINRVRPVITEIERIKDNVLIITHRVVARVLLGYFLNLSRDVIAHLDVPLHCVYCLESKPYGITWSLWEYDEQKDCFFKLPESVLNTVKVKEVGLVHKERRYSNIPTAPPSVLRSVSNPSIRKTDLNKNQGKVKAYQDKLNEYRNSQNGGGAGHHHRPSATFTINELENELNQLQANCNSDEGNEHDDHNDNTNDNKNTNHKKNLPRSQSFI